MIFLSYVGSFPLRRSYANIMQCTEDVLLIPVDYPNYIQLVDMIDQYLAPMANSGMGLSLESGKYFMKGDTIKFPEAFDNESLRILVELRNKEPYRNNIKGIKACVTGPFTLSSRILLRTRNPGIFGETALSNPSIVESLSNIVAKFAKYYQDLGADCIMIEEPILSVIVGKKILLNQYKNNGEYEKAKEVLFRGIRLSPNEWLYHYNLAVLFKISGEMDYALLEYERAIMLNPKALSAYVGKGSIYLQKEDIGKGIAVFQEVIHRRPEHALAHYYMAIAFHRLGRPEDAEEELELALHYAGKTNDRKLINRVARYKNEGFIEQGIAPED